MPHACDRHNCPSPCDALPVSSDDVARLDAEHNAAPERTHDGPRHLGGLLLYTDTDGRVWCAAPVTGLPYRMA